MISCGDRSEEHDNMEGSWKATWIADPKAFGETQSEISFTMDGTFDFEGENLTVTAMGYEGCIFGEDTISHTQKWKLSGDTLHLISDKSTAGISYVIMERTPVELELFLVEDITVRLERPKDEML